MPATALAAAAQASVSEPPVAARPRARTTVPPRACSSAPRRSSRLAARPGPGDRAGRGPVLDGPEPTTRFDGPMPSPSEPRRGDRVGELCGRIRQACSAASSSPAAANEELAALARGGLPVVNAQATTSPLFIAIRRARTWRAARARGTTIAGVRARRAHYARRFGYRRRGAWGLACPLLRHGRRFRTCSRGWTRTSLAPGPTTSCGPIGR